MEYSSEVYVVSLAANGKESSAPSVYKVSLGLVLNFWVGLKRCERFRRR